MRERRGCGARRRPRLSLQRAGPGSRSHGDQGRGEQLVPLTAAAGDQPGGEGQEKRGQLGQRVRQDAEDQSRRESGAGRRSSSPGSRGEGLGGEREEGHRADEEDRQLAGLDVDPAREAGRCAAAIGIEEPAMKPAIQAVPCRARTSELRQRIGSRSPGSEGSVRPGRWIGVMSGVAGRPRPNPPAASARSPG